MSATALVLRPADAEDLTACRAILRQGSKSFAAAALLLPPRVRAAATATYAFCRVADDAIDLGEDVDAAVGALHQRLDRLYADNPLDDPVDRAFCEVVQLFEIPKAVVLAMLEGFRWDAQGRRYHTLEELEAYCVRVASAVGVMMTLLMGRHQAQVLARACDLGLAMQLTNICRDVGEDARHSRLYLPTGWLERAGIDPQRFVAEPRFTPALGGVVERLLDVADGYYRRADLGIRMLPRDCRLAIRGARLIYADIGRVIRRRGFNTIDARAYTSKPRKLWLLGRATTAILWRRRPCPDPPQPAARFLVEAAATPQADA